jgi:hypothetical protein
MTNGKLLCARSTATGTTLSFVGRTHQLTSYSSKVVIITMQSNGTSTSLSSVCTEEQNVLQYGSKALIMMIQNKSTSLSFVERTRKTYFRIVAKS